MAPTKVGIVGATGETGSSIVNGLLEAGNFEIIALIRPTSIEKPATKHLQSQGITLRPCDLSSTQDHIVSTLQDIDVLISAIGPTEQLAQIPLATAAKTAGVKRFVPCAFLTVIPAGGIHLLRDVKEQVYNHTKILSLPYTIIDVGWWYQITVPPLPSGRTAYAISLGGGHVAGDGNAPSALTDLRDVGRYVARIIVDDRTLNEYVFVYNEVLSQNESFGAFARLSGEEVPTTILSEAELRRRIDSVSGAADDMKVLMTKVPAQYLYSWGIRGDNTPAYAKYLGYLDGKELYPDLQGTKYEDYVKEVLDGKAKTVYDELKERYQAMIEEGARVGTSSDTNQLRSAS